MDSYLQTFWKNVNNLEQQEKKFLVTRNFLTRIFDYIAKIEKDSQALFSMIVRVNFEKKLELSLAILVAYKSL